MLQLVVALVNVVSGIQLLFIVKLARKEKERAASNIVVFSFGPRMKY